MDRILKLEELALFLLSIYLFSLLPFSWWWYPVLLLVPDVSFAGYLAGKRAGAVTYNIVHHRALAVGLYLAGSLAGLSVLALAGVILFGHSCMDRVLGYGLLDLAGPNRFDRQPQGR